MTNGQRPPVYNHHFGVPRLVVEHKFNCKNEKVNLELFVYLTSHMKIESSYGTFCV